MKKSKKITDLQIIVIQVITLVTLLFAFSNFLEKTPENEFDAGINNINAEKSFSKVGEIKFYESKIN